MHAHHNALLARRKPLTTQGRIAVAVALASVMSLSLVSSLPGRPDAPWERPELAKEDSVRTTGVTATAAAADPTAGSILGEPPPDAAWPSAARSLVTPTSGTVSVGGLPVTVTGAAVEVETLNQEASRATGTEGLVLRVHGPKSTDTAATVSFDYTSFAQAFGADWGTRLRITALPDCALTTPARPECAGEPVSVVNSAPNRTLSTEIAPGASALLAITAAASGPAGNYAASSLSASQSWSAGSSTGDFSWSYPVPTPASNGSAQPSVSFDYSSGSVDGRNAASNNQPSWIGEGFEYEPGFIERKYIPCAQESDSGGNNATKTGDMCWFDDNAYLSVAGRATELLKDDKTGEWHAKSEDGSTIELKTGGPNGDDNGEYWVVTGVDGTKMWFGRNRLPGWTDGAKTTDSVWTMPVYGNNSGEPCHAVAFADSRCDQAWRWQLDYVEDLWGNTASYWYKTESNMYGANLKADSPVSYVRTGYLDHIDYGTRSDTAYGTPLQKVTFTVADRCLSNCAEHKTSNWPDVPWDQECTAAPCTDNYSPTFWTTKRLEKVTTWAWTGTQHSPVDTIKLRHSFRNPGDGTRAGLFLEGITRIGEAATPAITLPEVTFTGVQKPNRVDGLDNAPPMNWFRIASIRTETGGEIAVTYSPEDCKAGTRIPSEPGTNTWRCFPVWWNPAEFGDPDMDWFHKYVVTDVAVIDHTGSPGSRVLTSYTYSTEAAWHFDDGNGLTPKKHRTWSQWRGYERVTTTVGEPDVWHKQKRSETRFHRGMNGDKKPGGGSKEVTVTASDDSTAVDHDELAGRPREVITYDTSTTPNVIVGRVITDWWRSAATATQTVDGRLVHARLVQPSDVTGDTKLDGNRGWMTTANHTTYDGYGLATQVHDEGDLSKPSDDTCTKTTYARNSGAGLISLPQQVETFALNCTQSPASAADIIGITRVSYDGLAYGTIPTKGAATHTETAVDWVGGAPKFETSNKATYDIYGRVLTSTDAAGAMTTTTFTPVTGGPVTKVSVKNQLGHIMSTDVESLRGLKTHTVDANSRHEYFQHDALGRLLKVWLPGRDPATTTPDSEYVYTLRNNGPSAVATKKLIFNGNQVTTYALYDSLLRMKQTQTPAVGGGRVVTDQSYDPEGRPWKVYDSFYDSANAPGIELALPVDGDSVQALHTTEYDGLSRVAAQIFTSNGVEKWRTSYAYHGDRTDVTPPQGGTATSAVNDARGRTTELRQYAGPAPTGPYDSTIYTYNAKGLLEQVEDPAHNTWGYTYDLRGRLTGQDDPDRGLTTMTYDAADRVKSTTNAKLETLAYTYDALSRPRTVRDGSETGPIRIEWTYDTVPGAKGLLAKATRYHDTKAYTTAVVAYSPRYQPLATTTTIPAGHTGLSGTYTTQMSYYADGTPESVTVPAAGGLAKETIYPKYDETLGLPSKLTSKYGATAVESPYVVDTRYTALGQLQYVAQSTADFGAPTVDQVFDYEEGTQRLKSASVGRYPTSPNLVQYLKYTYDPAGNVTSITDAPDLDNPTSARNETQCFRYDNLRRLTEAWTPDSRDCSPDPPEATVSGASGYWQSYRYDKIGNRTQFVEHATSVDPSTTTTDYGHPSSGPTSIRPHTLTSTKTTTTPGNGTFTHTYTYDDTGNTRIRPDGNGKLQTLTWDAEGHLDQITDTDTSEVLGDYIYGPDGQRLIAKDTTGETLYLGGQEIHVAKNTGDVTGTRHYSHAGLTVAVRTSKDGLTWLTADHQGTSSLAISQDTTTVQQRRQDPFGNLRGSQPITWPDKKGFVGGDNDPTGLTHIGAREYDPTTGRFISDDPITNGDPQQAHGYAYANNTPISSSDPSGLELVDFFGAGGGNSLGDLAGVISGSAPKGMSAEVAMEFASYIPILGEAIEAVKIIDAIKDGRYAEAGALLAEAAISGIVGRVAPGLGKLLIKGGKKLAGWVAKSFKLGGNAADEVAEAIGDGLKRNDDEFTDPDYWDDLKDPSGKPANTPDKAPEATPDKSNGSESSTGSGNGKCNCFTEGTSVAMSDGSFKSIEEVRPGDRVVTYNTKTGDKEDHVVTGLFKKSADRLLQITVHGADDRGRERKGTAKYKPSGNEVSGADPPDQTQTLTVTPEHPFWRADSRAWMTAGDLKLGDELLQRDGDHVTIVDITLLERPEPFIVYNFSVDMRSNYFASSVDVLVHNCPTSPKKSDDDDDMLNKAKEQDERRARIEGAGGQAKQYEKLTSDAVKGSRPAGGIAEVGVPQSTVSVPPPMVSPPGFHLTLEGMVFASVVIGVSIVQGAKKWGGRFVPWRSSKPGRPK